MSMYTKKGFWGGEHGHVHTLQEFGVVASIVGFVSWLISPVIGAALGIYILRKADFYWWNREIKQSVAQGRLLTPGDSDRKNIPVSDFWTEDGKADVEHPRRFRKLWWILSAAYVYWMFTQVGITGLLLQLIGL